MTPPVQAPKQRQSRYERAHQELSGQPQEAGLRWAIYLRISKDKTKQAKGVGRQRQDCEAKIASLGGSLVDVYDDNDRSGYKGVRKQYDRLQADLLSGRVNAVMIAYFDRLGRDTGSNETFARLLRGTGARLFDLGGEVPLDTANGKVMFTMQSGMSQWYSEVLAEKISRKMVELREEGKSTGGGRFYGWVGWYCDDPECTKMHMPMTIVPEEAALIEECCDRVLAGESLNSIHRSLNAAGRYNASGKPWDRRSLKAMLIRARNAGLVEQQEKRDKEFGTVIRQRQVIAKATDWEPIVSEDVWRSVRTILEDADRKQHYTTNRVQNLLSYIATCSECGDWMIAGKGGNIYTLADGTKKKHEARIYKCRRSPERQPVDGSRLRHPARRLEAIDTYVTEQVLQRLAKEKPEDLLRVHLDDEQAQIEEELRSVDAQMDEHAALLGDGALTPGQFTIANARLMERRNALMLRQEPVRNDQVLRDFLGDDPVREVWEDEDFDVHRKRAVIRALVKSIVIKPGRRGSSFDEDSVIIEWS